jgi:cytochrome c oxidase cbb3-type subunit 3
MKQRMRAYVCSVVFGVAGLTAVTTAQEGDRVDISPMLALRADALILARCSVCHSPDLIHQQRLPQNRWAATVEKMQHWGAELSHDEAALLIRYLAARYHPGAPDQLPPLDSEAGRSEPLIREPAADGPLIGMSGKGSGIYAHNCQACHGEKAAGGVGPDLARNAILKNESAFWETVLHGRGPMPAWEGILNEQDIADIHAWLIGLSSEF